MKYDETHSHITHSISLYTRNQNRWEIVARIRMRRRWRRTNERTHKKNVRNQFRSASINLSTPNYNKLSKWNIALYIVIGGWWWRWQPDRVRVRGRERESFFIIIFLSRLVCWFFLFIRTKWWIDIYIIIVHIKFLCSEIFISCFPVIQRWWQRHSAYVLFSIHLTSILNLNCGITIRAIQLKTTEPYEDE